ncbi:MAG: SulP family inorganic anion transporter [Bacteroidota bacterium]|nr:SulP family inorganic anion transporter [Bacteroidota bacterium]
MKTQPNGGVPSDNIEGFLNNWKFDLKSGFVVALLSLPMSFGIAIASGFPPLSGIIASIVGGIFAGLFTGSSTSIKGPAGGLSAIVLSGSLVLGGGDILIGYQYALASIVIAGLFQILFGLLKFGKFSSFFPASTIHGMLAALGFSMAIRQFHPALGVTLDTNNIIKLIQQIPNTIENLNPKVLLISLITLSILIASNYITNSKLRYIPSVLVAVIVSIVLSFYLGMYDSHAYEFMRKSFTVDAAFFVLPVSDINNIRIVFPDFSKILSYNSVEFIVLIFFAATIETLLSAKAIDKIDPYKRNSNLNQDLVSVGIGTTLSAFVGGLPLISESKRSIVSLDQGAKTRMANIFHGLILVAIIFSAMPIFSYIPLPTLAAILIYTGARMTTPTEFSKSYKVGAEQFLVFIVTFSVTIFSNFIYGVIIGLVTELLVHLRFGLSLPSLFISKVDVIEKEQNVFDISINSPAVFSNYLLVSSKFENLPLNGKFNFDFSKSPIVDHTFMEHLQSFEEKINSNGGSLQLSGFEYHKYLSDHPLASKRIVKNKPLTFHQKELAKYCANHQLEFQPRIVNSPNKFEGLNLNASHTVKTEENVVQWYNGNTKFELSDVNIEQINTVTNKQEISVTICVIEINDPLIPEFLLHKEGFIDALYAIVGYNDIDFVEFPTFSYYYLLKGKNEFAIRSYFNPIRIQFFEKNKGYNLNYFNGKLFIFKRMNVLSFEEKIEMISFANNVYKTII